VPWALFTHVVCCLLQRQKQHLLLVLLIMIMASRLRLRHRHRQRFGVWLRQRLRLLSELLPSGQLIEARPSFRRSIMRGVLEFMFHIADHRSLKYGWVCVVNSKLGTSFWLSVCCPGPRLAHKSKQANHCKFISGQEHDLLAAWLLDEERMMRGEIG